MVLGNRSFTKFVGNYKLSITFGKIETLIQGKRYHTYSYEAFLGPHDP